MSQQKQQKQRVNKQDIVSQQTKHALKDYLDSLRESSRKKWKINKLKREYVGGKPSKTSVNINPIRSSLTTHNLTDPDNINNEDIDLVDNNNLANPIFNARITRNTLTTSTPLKSSKRFVSPELIANQAPEQQGTEVAEKTAEIEPELSTKRRSSLAKRKLDYLAITAQKEEIKVATKRPANQELLNDIDDSFDDPVKYKKTIRKSVVAVSPMSEETVSVLAKPVAENIKSQETVKTVKSKAKTKNVTKAAKLTTTRIEEPTTASATTTTSGPRRSKRTRVDITETACYKYEEIDHVMVRTLVSTQRKKIIPIHEFSQLFIKVKPVKKSASAKTTRTIKASKQEKQKKPMNKEAGEGVVSQKKAKRMIATEAVIKEEREDQSSITMNNLTDQTINTSQETVCVDYTDENHDDNNIDGSVSESEEEEEKKNKNIITDNAKLYIYARHNSEREYVECMPNVGMATLSNKDAIIRIEPKRATASNIHEFKSLYFVQQGTCLLSMNGVVSKHSEKDVFVVPKDVKYKIQNKSDSHMFLYYVIVDS